MKVDNPKFNHKNPAGTVACSDCPFTDEDGYCEKNSPLYDLCNSWGHDHVPRCPVAENYIEACVLAESVCGL